MADTFFSIPDINGSTLNHRSATNGSSYQHPATSLFLFGGGTPVEVNTTNLLPSGLYFSRNASNQLITLDTSTPANNRGLPVVLLSGSASAPFDTNAGATAATTLRTVAARNTDVTHTETQLTAPGTTTVRSFSGYRYLSCTYKVASINTNVVVEVEGRMTGSSDWVTLDPSQTTTTITANGTYGFRAILTVEDIQFNFVSESGGTAATIDVILRFGV